MQIHELFDDGQSHAGPGAITDIAGSMKGLKKLGKVCGGNSDARIADQQLNAISRRRFYLALGLCVAFNAFHLEGHRLIALRVFDRIAEEIAQDVAQDPFVKKCFARNGINGAFD